MRKRFGKREAAVSLCVVLALMLVVFAAGRPKGQPDLQQADAPVGVQEDRDAQDQAKREQGAREQEPNKGDANNKSLPQVEPASAEDDFAEVIGDADYEPEADASEEEPEDGQVSEVFVMPEGANYESQVALCSVDPSASMDEVTNVLSQIDGVVAAEVTEDGISSGMIRVWLAEGVSVEDGVNELLSSGAVDGAQPNYLYRASDLIESSDEVANQTSDDATEDGSNVIANADTAGDDSVADDAAGDAVDDSGSQKDGEDSSGEEVFSSVDQAEAADETSQERGTNVLNEGEAEDKMEAEGLDEEPMDAQDSADIVSAEATTASVNDPMAKEQWGLDSVQAYEAWSLQKTSGTVTVAVIDMGFDLNHPDLKDNLWPAYNAHTKDSNIPKSDAKNRGHGTHVAGIIAGVSNNGIGISGVSYNAKVLPIMIAYSDGSGSEWVTSSETLNHAYDYAIANAADKNVRVVNMSIGRTTLEQEGELEKKIKDAYYNKNIVTVASAGNLDSTRVPHTHYPSDIDECVAVMSLEKTESGVRRNSQSNYNMDTSDHKDICAPGTSIKSTYPDSQYVNLSGASMATPFVSSIVALEFAAKPSLTAKEAVDILYATAIDLGDAGWDTEYGWGEANAYAAVYGVKYGIDEGKKRAVEEHERRQKEEQENRDKAAAESVQYRTHVQNVGWQGWKSNGETSGTSGRGLRLEGIKMVLSGAPYSGDIQYRTHVQNIGWQGWKSNGALSGTSGRALRLEAIEIALTDQMAEHYDIWYRVHAQDFGWLGWAKNGERSGTATYAKRLEAIEVKVLPKGSSAPGDTSRPYVTTLVGYRTHVQDYGWQRSVSDGSISGTMGKSKRLEGIEISFQDQLYSGGIQYRTHVQNIGWQGWRRNGAMSGTSGRGLRLEAIQISLTGQMADHYDVWYRVHCQNIGWMGWAKNGANAGTAGYGYRLEGIQICLVPKDGAAPGSTANSFRQR